MLYENLNWTFHAKGIWLVYAAPNPMKLGGTETAPTSTYIGSSNMGHRSWARDFELGFLLTTQKQNLKDILAKEWEHLSSYTRDRAATTSVNALLKLGNATCAATVRSTATQAKLPALWKISIARYLSKCLKSFL